MKVLHVEAGRHMYGGACQVLMLIDGLRRQRVDNVLVCPPESAIGAGARATRVVEISMRGDLDLALIMRLRNVILRERPDIVHLHSRRGADWLGALAARSAAVPAVLSRRVDNTEARLVARAKYRLVDRVIAISEAIRAVLLAAGVDERSVVCVRDAVPQAQAAARDRRWLEATFGVPAQAPLLGVIAQLIERKGHRYLVDALPQVMRAHPATHCLFLGRGVAEADLRERCARLGLETNVHFVGFRLDIHRILPNLDLVVHPALREGLGVALLEAAQAGLPVVATRAGGVPEAVQHGETGLLVAPGDDRELAAAITRLLDDPLQRQQMGRNGAERVAREFAPERMVAGNLAVYRDVLAASAR